MKPISDNKCRKVKESKPLAIDLFSGCGGLTCGLISAGYDVVGAIEIDPRARETYAMNYPEIPFLGADIREADPIAIMRKLGLRKGQLDLLAGCPPCQGFSRIRKLNKSRPARDPRNSLIDDFAKFVFEMQPKLIMLENVPGLEKHFRFGDFVKGLLKVNYSVTFEVLNVANYGVPQRRKRLILVAALYSKPRLAQPLNEIVTVRKAIGHLKSFEITKDNLHQSKEKRSARVEEIIRSIPKDGGSRDSLPQHLVLKCHKLTDGFKDVYGRMSWDQVAPTITGGCTNPSKGRFLHPTKDRAITLREAAMLQGFPEDYKFNLQHGKGAIALMIGNALPPPFIHMHARELRSIL